MTLTQYTREDLIYKWMKNIKQCATYGHMWRDVGKINPDQATEMQRCKCCMRWRTKPDNQHNEPTGW